MENSKQDFICSDGRGIRIIILEDNTETEIWRSSPSMSDGQWHQSVTSLGHIRNRFKVKCHMMMFLTHLCEPDIVSACSEILGLDDGREPKEF